MGIFDWSVVLLLCLGIFLRCTQVDGLGGGGDARSLADPSIPAVLSCCGSGTLAAPKSNEDSECCQGAHRVHMGADRVPV